MRVSSPQKNKDGISTPIAILRQIAADPGRRESTYDMNVINFIGCVHCSASENSYISKRWRSVLNMRLEQNYCRITENTEQIGLLCSEIDDRYVSGGVRADSLGSSENASDERDYEVEIDGSFASEVIDLPHARIRWDSDPPRRQI